ncbi:MAG: type II toxin-antitoxin system Phd/YefM family antitoxin [Caldilineaceae bacterium]|jgi:prevent-host-death family protein|nr:type II toxin-antitoxin system Phd/YefM family antitoxin [Caldilineaceae bacterium]
MQTIPISDLRFHQAEVLDQLQQRPVVLTRQGRAAAVLVSPDEWNSVVQQLEDLEDALAVLQARLQIETGVEELLDWESAKTELTALAASDEVHG